MNGLKPTFCDNPSSATNEDIFNELDNWTDSQISKETKKLLSEGDKIVSHMAKLAKKDPEEYGEKYATMLKEREELQSVTVKAFCNDRKILKDELLDLKKEFGDVQELSARYRDKAAMIGRKAKNASSEYFEDTKRGFQYIGNGIREESEEFTKDTKRGLQHIGNEIEKGVQHIEEEVKKEGFKHTRWQTYSREEAMRALAETQDTYTPTKDWFWFTNTVASIDNDKERDAFQLKVISKILGKGKVFDNENIVTYNENVGYNVMKIEDLEEQMYSNIDSISDKTLKNYLKATEDLDNKDSYRMDIKEEISFRNRPIEEYSAKDASIALTYSHKDFGNLGGIWKDSWTSKMNEISNNNERDAFQKRVIKHVFATFPDMVVGHIKMYREDTGYDLVSIETFEEKFQNTDINEVSTEALKDYLQFLKEKHWEEAGNVILKKIDINSVDWDSKNAEIIEDFLGKWSKIIDMVNSFRSAEWIQKDLQKWVTQVKDPLLQKYIQNEIDKLNAIEWRSWPSKEYSLLLLSVMFKQLWRPLVTKNIATHETAQKNIINRLNKQGMNLVIAHTEELSYYPIEIWDYENEIFQKQNMDDLNPLALANYLDYLAKTWWVNQIFSKLPYEKLEQLQKVLGEDSSKTKEILKNRGLNYITEIITNFSPDSEKNILENIQNLKSREEQKAALIYMKRNLVDMQAKFRRDIVESNPHIADLAAEKQEEIFNKFIEIVKNASTGTELKDIINDVDTWMIENDIEDIEKNSIDSVVEQAEIQSVIDYVEAEQILDSAETPEAKTVAEIQVKKAQDNVRKAWENKAIVRAATEPELQDLADGKISQEELMQNLKARDEDFAKKMERFEEKEILVLPKSEIIETELQQAFVSERTTEWTYTIETPQGEKIEGLTEVEFKEVSKSKEARDNLVDMKHILEESNLDYFWENRDIIFTAIGNMNTLWFDTTDWNYVNPAELKFILAMVVGSVKDELWEQYEARVLSLENTWSLPEAINLVKDINWESWVLSTEDVNHFWDSKITKLFIDKFIPRESSQVFNHSKFQESF